jgi:flagellar FliJ protein
MRFRFALQRLLHLREQHEQAMARELINARAAADEEHRIEESLKDARDVAQRRIAREAASSPVGTLQVLQTACDHFDESVAAAGERTVAAHVVVAEKHQALTLASQARRILDRLRSRRKEAYTGEVNSADQRTMDSIALARFVRDERRVDPARQGTGT